MAKSQQATITTLDKRKRLIQEREHELKCQELEAREMELQPRSQALQLHRLQLQAPVSQTKPQIMPVNYRPNDRRDTEARSTASSRRSSGIESGSSKDLSYLTLRDPVTSHSTLQESRAPSKSRRAQSQISSLRSLSPQRSRKLETYYVKCTQSEQDRTKTVQPQDLGALKNDLAAMMRDMIKSS